MAREEIKLVGSFKDDITPQLKKLNKEIANIGRSFERFNKKLSPVTKNFAKMAMSAKEFSTAMAGQRKAMDSSTRAMMAYRKEAGKMSASMKRVTDARMKAQRQMGVSRAQARKGGGMMPGMGGPTKGGGGGGAAYGAAAAKGFNTGIGSIAIGSAIGNMASQAIMRGVSGLGRLITAPFKKFGTMFAERIGDEMDDIKSAGGLFALDMDLTQASGNERFFKNYNEALRFQEKLNIDMAESAASLPGVTSQYVSTSRQLTDTIQMVMEKDREGFGKMATAFGADTSMGGVDASKNAMQTVLKKQTEQVMLQSQGQTGGLPMHIMIQQLMGKEAKGGKLGIQAFTNKFRAAFQKNPLLKNFLMRAEDELSKTEAGSVDRLRILMETFDRAMPKEVINKMRGSISGMQEALRSGLLDPQAGLFGMSRANFDANGELLQKNNVDDFGNTLFKMTEATGKVTKDMAKKLKKMGIEKTGEETLAGVELTLDQLQELGFRLGKSGQILARDGKTAVGEVSKSSTYIFEQIREIMAGYGPVLLEFVGFLPQLFDPFGEMTGNLMNFRDTAQQFISGFNKKLDILEEQALAFTSSDKDEEKGLGAILKKQSRSRAALAHMADFLGEDVVGTELFKDVKKLTGEAKNKEQIEAFDKGAGALGGKMIKAIFNSDMMKEFGKIGGIIIGGITKAVVDMIKMATGVFKGKGVNKLAEGFTEGIKTAFGDMSFNDVKKTISDAVVSILTKVMDVLFTNVLPNLLDMYIGGLFQALLTGGIVSKVFALVGIISLVSTVITAVTTAIGIATTVFTVMSGVVGFLSANFAILSGAVGVIAITILAPIAAIAGAIMIVIAIVRNFGSILKMVGGIFQVVIGTLAQAVSALIGGLGNILSKIPGLGFLGNVMKGFGDHVKQMGEGMAQGGREAMVEAGTAMANQFQEDSAAIRAKLGMSQSPAQAPVPVTPEAPAAPQSASQKRNSRRGSGMRNRGAEAAVKAHVEATNKQTQAAADAIPKIEATSTAMEGLTTNLDDLAPKIETTLVGASETAGAAIVTSASGLASALNGAATAIKNAGNASSSSDSAKNAFGGSANMGRSMGIADAIATEKKHMPAGADLVIANSSETIIPAFAGNVGQPYKGLKFEEMESAAGFNRMASYTEQIKEIADKTAEKFAGVGTLGGGSATLNAMESLGHSFGLMTTSGFRPGDPGFHGVNRARDLSNGGGETPEMNAAAAKMAGEFGSSLTELIYTPMGFSIKNGQKTGLISPDNHYHHIHVAVAEGLKNAAVFSSEQAALQYEKSMMPNGASPMKVDLASMTANSSEIGGGGGDVQIGSINISGVDNPKEIANQVAEEILYAVRRSGYGELYTS